ncbi:MAG TPA: hypothetical protein VEW25_03400 [Allosphingosinicella sp.]|nr:hypothetical protein [Allosphingosinicella sp.]
MIDAAAPSTAFPAPVIWLVRRLVLPTLASAVLVEAILLLAWGATLLYSVPLHERASRLPPEGLLLAAAIVGCVLLVVIGFGLLLFGVPAGYLVARLKLGFGPSLAGLVALGGFAGGPLLLPMLAAGGSLHAMPLGIAALFAVSGAATAAIWTLINADLFRHHDGA